MIKKKKEIVRRTITYRRCIIQPKQSQTLQQLVSSALGLKSVASDRQEPLNTQSTMLRCIGAQRTISNCLCGYLTVFEKGAAQPVIGDDPTAASLRLSVLAPPPAAKGGVQQQFIPGVVYFAIFGNHVALVQSASMRGAALESHLSWLLKERTSLLKATDGFALSDEAQKVTREKIKKSHVKRIALGQPLMNEVTCAAPVEGASSQGKSKKAPKQFRPAGAALEFLRQYIPSDDDFEKLGLDGVFDGNLELWVEIRYPSRKRTKSEDSIALMDTLGVVLRDVEPEQVVLELEDGNLVRGSELKITSTLDVQVLESKLPDEQKLWDSMVEWLTFQLQNGVVDP